jgi:ATP-dependent exoDNAse (exonuclease V) alpha subunit
VIVELKSLETEKELTPTVITRDDGRSVPTRVDALYSTEAMLALEQRALSAYAHGRTAAISMVPPELINEVLSREAFARLSDEQRDFVASLTGSSIRIQAGVGAAGSGKTTALKAAVAIWHEAGYKVLGAAVGGTQAIVLSEETGIEAKTVASVLARYFDHGDLSIADDRTVVLVDEASLLSTRDFAALARIAEERGAMLRVIGDPAQHSSVNAGGIFRYLVAQYPDETPALTHLYRQQGPEMEEVRLANAEFREGQIAKALERLARDGRITEAKSAEEAYDLLTCAWYVERQRRNLDPERRRSAMTAEHHVERRELITRARALLIADGALNGPELRVGELCFQAGDEVIARVVDRSLRADGADRDAYIRNGSLGRVERVLENGLIVDFERWGSIEVPLSYIEQKLPSGVVGGLQHAYALTTHAAQGDTFAVATPLVTDASSVEGVYVGITRGQFDLQGVVIRSRDLIAPDTDDDLPVLDDETNALRAAEYRLLRMSNERLATELSPRTGKGDNDCETVMSQGSGIESQSLPSAEDLRAAEEGAIGQIQSTQISATRL